MIQRWRDERGSVLAVELLVCAPLLARMVDSYGQRRVMAPSLLVSALAIAGIAVVVLVSTPKIDMERSFREMFVPDRKLAPTQRWVPVVSARARCTARSPSPPPPD